MSKKQRTPNDQSSDVHNLNSPEHKAMLDNRSKQLNPDQPVVKPTGKK